ncbi:MAG: hypothetical protein KID00_09270 [Clostridium argentinense]|uniref:DUF2383 domain-containing protein n=1 Tax=Clostridium faecium TaxID=2762223 RepID=A0ABR8YXG7_9CLOT|nr:MULTISPECIES: hypothetical protein [Clostridium]MBD8048534.1 hypothetical protein [Clostridium faecium]MBS5824034.1 hypothetical protein [Clostridium argentinense]MDU1350751.1 hypothetical protein [Clostridium argentinense]
MICPNQAAINNIIEKEEILIRKYRGYLKAVNNRSIQSSIEELIQKHNNHIEVLQQLLRR